MGGETGHFSCALSKTTISLSTVYLDSCSFESIRNYNMKAAWPFEWRCTAKRSYLEPPVVILLQAQRCRAKAMAGWNILQQSM